MAKPHLLEGEELLQRKKPVPFSFSHLFALPVALVAAGIGLWFLYHHPSWGTVTSWPFIGDVGQPAAYVVWYLVVLLLGVIASVVLIQWGLFFTLLGGLIAGTVVLLAYGGWRLPADPFLFIPAWTVLMGGVGILLVELHRQTHRYYITNYRLIFQGGLLGSHERSLRYSKITDVDGSRSLVGRILGYGTIIPVTASGFGLGSDQSFAGLGAGAGGEKGGASVGVGAFAGGGKEVQSPRARTYYALHGVWPYRRVKNLLEELVQENTDIPYMRKQAETLDRIEDLLSGQPGPEDQKEN